MKMGFGTKSLALFALSVLFFVLLTLFESLLLNMPIAGERILSVLLLVLPALVGVVLGFLGIRRREDRIWKSVLGVLLNTLFALFFIFLLSFAG